MLALAIAASLAPSPADRLPSAAATKTLARVTAALEDLHQDPNFRTAGNGSVDRAKCLKIVDEGLDQLVTDLGEPAAAEVARGEGRSLAAKLVAIGLDRRKHPGAYDALAEVYGDENGNGRAATGIDYRGGPQSVLLRPKHVRPAYRLAWEYRVLVFPALYEVTRNGSPTFEGVHRVRNEASILTLSFAFRHACYDGLRGRDDGQCRSYILTTLEHTPGPAALRAILECAEWAEGQWLRRKPNTPDTRGDPAGWAARLADAPAEADREKWRAAAAAVAKGPLPARQKAMLAALQKRLPAR